MTIAAASASILITPGPNRSPRVHEYETASGRSDRRRSRGQHAERVRVDGIRAVMDHAEP